MSKGDSDKSTMSDESIGLLEDVKKGKARKFAMICKGTSIVSLVVYKKGSVEKRKKEAKESGKGLFYFGVIDGRGMEISFKLARADGFDSAPVKNVTLKDYLAEAADLKFKPIFEIVDSLQLVLDDSDPLVQRFLALQERAFNACEAHPDRATEINGLCLSIGQNFDRDELEQVVPQIESLEKLLASLTTNASAGGNPSQNPNAQTSKEEISESNDDGEPQDPLADWKETRTWAIDGLRDVAKAIAAERHQESAKAIIELKAVIANLTESPTTAQQVSELRRYLEQDDVVLDVCELAFDIRTPLLNALPQFEN